MSEDWRLRIRMREQGTGRQLAQSMDAAALEQDLVPALPERVVVSHDEDEVFCYTETREQAERVRAAVSRVAADTGRPIETELTRWHPASEEWEDPDEPLPATPEQVSTEHSELMERERQESQEQGYPDFEVRVHCRSRADAIELADRLQAEGISSLRRWHYVLIGAPDEDTAAALASRISQESPPDAVVTTEGSGPAAYSVRPGNPFAVFGGLGG